MPKVVRYFTVEIQIRAHVTTIDEGTGMGDDRTTERELEVVSLSVVGETEEKAIRRAIGLLGANLPS